MPEPYFSIIITFYNKEKTIEACIKALLSQDFPEDRYEIIAVNNNSTDKSISIVQRYPQVKLIHEKYHQNAYASRNTGIKNAAGHIIAFTDADTEIPENWLSNIYTSINKDNYDILIGWYLPARPVKLLQLHCDLTSLRIKKAIEQNNTSLLTACGANLIIKKHVFEKEGMFLINSNSEDANFTARCLKKRYRIGFEDNIAIKRNDINSINILLLKNFYYGCAEAISTKEKLPGSVTFSYIPFITKFIFKHFPIGLGLISFTLSYLTGYFLTRLMPFNLNIFSSAVYKYINKKEE